MPTKTESQMNAFTTFFFKGTDIPNLSRFGRLKPFLKRIFLFLIVPFTLVFSLITMIFNERWWSGLLYLSASKEDGSIDYVAFILGLLLSLLPGLFLGVLLFFPSCLMILLGRLRYRRLVFWLALTTLIMAPFDYWVLPGLCFWGSLIILLFGQKTTPIQ